MREVDALAPAAQGGKPSDSQTQIDQPTVPVIVLGLLAASLECVCMQRDIYHRQMSHSSPTTLSQGRGADM